MFLAPFIILFILGLLATVSAESPLPFTMVQVSHSIFLMEDDDDGEVEAVIRIVSFCILT